MRNTPRMLLGSSVWLKSCAAASGLLLLLWITLHAFGLLAAFGGPAAIDGYGAMLHARPWLLWSMRVALLVALAVHSGAALLLARRARAARGGRRAALRHRPASFASRSMRTGGVALLGFVVLHVLHMTTGTLHPAFAPGHVYANLTRGLGAPLVASAYLAAALAIGLHVLHGLWAAPRSLGLGERHARATRPPLVVALALAVALGFAAVPIAVLAGVVR
jgi:succinate dehydrogenase / fumarate reductase cytochrome b subunit